MEAAPGAQLGDGEGFERMNGKKSLLSIAIRVLLLIIGLFALAGGIYYLATSSDAELYPAGPIAFLSFVIIWLLYRQYRQGREIVRLRSLTSNITEFERDVARRLAGFDNALSTGAQVNITSLHSQQEALGHALKEASARIQLLEQRAPETDRPTAPTAPELGEQSASRPRKSVGRINIKSAVNEDGLTMHLQPIVQLPKRQPLHYEAFMRLKLADGTFLDASQFIQLAEKGQLMPTIDKKVLFSSVRMLRTLATMNKRAGLFCNIALSTLKDARSMKEITSFLEANTSLKASLVLEISQQQYRSANAAQKQRLRDVADLGFSLSMDQVLDLNLDPTALRQEGFRFVKVPAGIMLHSSLNDHSAIPAAELSMTLLDAGIKMIGSEVEKEDDAMSLIDFNISIAQGNLFAPPRPVKADLLKGSSPTRGRGGIGDVGQTAA